MCMAVFLVADLLGRAPMRQRLLLFAVVLAPFAGLRLALSIAFAQPAVEIDLWASQLKWACPAPTDTFLMLPEPS